MSQLFGFVADRLSASIHLLGFRAATCLPQQSGVVLQDPSHVRVLWPHGLLPSRQRALEERLRVGIAALDNIEQSQVVEVRSHMCMLGSEGFLADRQRAFVERFGVGIAALDAI